MNIPFTNINSIIYPNSENVPSHLLYFVSALYRNSYYREDIDKIRTNLEHESHYNDYPDSYISYLLMMRETYSLFTEGITYILFYTSNYSY